MQDSNDVDSDVSVSLAWTRLYLLFCYERSCNHNSTEKAQHLVAEQSDLFCITGMISVLWTLSLKLSFFYLPKISSWLSRVKMLLI